MHISDIVKALRIQPFQPFRLYVSDGAVYDVQHPELLMPQRRSILVGMPGLQEGEMVAADTVTIDLLHITRIEPILSSPSSSTNGSS